MKAFAICLLPLFFTALLINRQSAFDNNPIIIGRGQLPMLASGDPGKIHLVYGTGDSLLYRSFDKDHLFDKPQLVATVPGLNAASMRGPQIASTKNGLCVVASTKGGSIYSFLQNKAGNWRKSARVTDVDSVALEGFVSLAGDGNSTLFAVWLDLRKNKRNKIYGARSTDGGKTWSENIMVYTSPDTTVCECCKPTVVMKGSNVYVLFRNWLNGNRDLYLIQSQDYGHSFGAAKRLGTQSWALNGCPMDGGSLVVDNNGNAQTVWNRKGTIYACEPGKEEKALGQGRSCTMETVNGKKVYAWVENKQVVVLLPQGIKKVLGKGQLPVLKAVDNKEVLCVWENEKQIISSLVSL